MSYATQRILALQRLQQRIGKSDRVEKDWTAFDAERDKATAGGGQYNAAKQTPGAAGSYSKDNMDKYIAGLHGVQDKYHQAMGFTSSAHDSTKGFSYSEGQKYNKVFAGQAGHRSVHSFVNRDTGDIHYPKGAAGPTKQVRGNIGSPSNGMEAIGPTAHVRYLKSDEESMTGDNFAFRHVRANRDILLIKTDFKPGDRVRMNVGAQCAGQAGTVKHVSGNQVQVQHDGVDGPCDHDAQDMHTAHEFTKEEVIKAGLEVTTDDDPKGGVHVHKIAGQLVGHTIKAVGDGTIAWTAVPQSGAIKGKFKSQDEAKQYLADQHGEGIKTKAMQDQMQASMKPPMKKEKMEKSAQDTTEPVVKGGPGSGPSKGKGGDSGKHSGNWATCKHCNKLVGQFESEGMNTSDAQGVAMAAHRQAVPPTTAHKDSIPRSSSAEKSHQKDLGSDNWHTRTMAQNKDKSNDALRYTQKDAHEAAKAAHSMGNTEAEGKYTDEGHYASMELKARSDHALKKGDPDLEQLIAHAEQIQKACALLQKGGPGSGPKKSGGMRQVTDAKTGRKFLIDRFGNEVKSPDEAAENEKAMRQAGIDKARQDDADRAYAKRGYDGRPDPDAAAMQRYGKGMRAAKTDDDEDDDKEDDKDKDVEKGGPGSGRKYPSYSTEHLENFVAAGRGTPEMVQEIADRKSGKSTVKVTPQIMGGIVMPRIGRM